MVSNLQLRCLKIQPSCRPDADAASATWLDEDRSACIAEIRDFPAHFVVPRHELPFASVELLLRGAHPETCAGVERVCRVGQAQYRPPDVPLSGRVAGGGACEFALRLPDERDRNWRGVAPIRQADYPRDPEGDPRLTHIAMQALFEFLSRDASSNLSIESHVAGMLAVLRPLRTPERGRPAWLGRVVDRIRDEPESRLGDLAREADVDASHLVRTFRQRFGCTPGAYQRLVRLEAAATALASTAETIARVALDHGFADQSHFGRHFRRHFGITPAVYRERFSAVVRGAEARARNEPVLDPHPPAPRIPRGAGGSRSSSPRSAWRPC